MTHAGDVLVLRKRRIADATGDDGALLFVGAPPGLEAVAFTHNVSSMELTGAPTSWPWKRLLSLQARL